METSLSQFSMLRFGIPSSLAKARCVSPVDSRSALISLIGCLHLGPEHRARSVAAKIEENGIELAVVTAADRGITVEKIVAQAVGVILAAGAADVVENFAVELQRIVRLFVALAGEVELAVVDDFKFHFFVPFRGDAPLYFLFLTIITIPPNWWYVKRKIKIFLCFLL